MGEMGYSLLLVKSLNEMKKVMDLLLENTKIETVCLGSYSCIVDKHNSGAL